MPDVSWELKWGNTNQIGQTLSFIMHMYVKSEGCHTNISCVIDIPVAKRTNMVAHEEI